MSALLLLMLLNRPSGGLSNRGANHAFRLGQANFVAREAGRQGRAGSLSAAPLTPCWPKTAPITS
jgi:hypothetical protein